METETRLIVSSTDKKLRQDLEEAFKAFDPVFVESAEEAELALLEGAGDVLIYDLGSNGTLNVSALEVIRKMRPRLPVIVLAGEDRLKRGERLLEMGIFYLLSKPVSLETLMTLVESALQKSRNAFRV